MSTLYVDTITEKTSGNGVQIADLVPAAGSVVQVVHANLYTIGGVSTSSSGAFVASGLTASITPTSSTSKIYVSIQGGGVYNRGYNATGVFVSVYRSINGGAYTDISGDSSYGMMRYSGSSSDYDITPISGAALDSPATSSVITYEVYFRSSNTNLVDFDTTDRGTPSITLMEIAQ